MNSKVFLFFNKIKDHLNTKYLLGAVVAFVLTSIYIFSKSQETTVTEYYKQEVPDFDKGQILEKQSVDFYRKKDKFFRLEAKNLKNQNKELEKRLKAIEKNLENLALKKENPKVDKNESPIQASKDYELKSFLDSLKNQQPQKYPEIKALLENSRDNSVSLVKEASSRTKIQKRKKRAVKGPETLSFPVKKGKAKEEVGPVLPSGSFAKGAILTGIDATSGRTLPSLIELDFAYIAPNQHKVDLRGCFLIMKSSADISSERVEMQPERISCVSRTGSFFEKKTNGFVADGFDNRFAMRGKLIEKFGTKLLKATIASALEGAGKAIQLSQTSTQTNPLGGQSTQVSGSTGKVIAGGAASQASSMIAKWYLGQVQKMLPVIRVESGKAVWVVMTEKIELPKYFFRKVTKERVNVPKF